MVAAGTDETLVVAEFVSGVYSWVSLQKGKGQRHGQPRDWAREGDRQCRSCPAEAGGEAALLPASTPSRKAPASPGLAAVAGAALARVAD
ncbi:hypothetical protein Smic_06950 [Streptomyces microflavus]|uniref:Uncharacterized protein n=1 Tax=Streptomyces microflavus TaxID=1919 RepID=A0A7J0CI97_STRMI|nr:hypothetical protein Smic_06950 [Streptomyces microflavus]